MDKCICPAVKGLQLRGDVKGLDKIMQEEPRATELGVDMKSLSIYQPKQVLLVARTRIFADTLIHEWFSLIVHLFTHISL